jgi:ferredoxin
VAEDVCQRRIGELTVRIDRMICIASGNCMKIAPELFALDEERIVDFRDAAPPADPERVLEACRVCPVDALSVYDAAGRRLVP